MPKKFSWICGRYEYEWNEVTTRRYVIFGEEETRWLLYRKGTSGSETLEFTPAKYRSFLKLQKTKPCKVKSSAMFVFTKGEADMAFDLYWYRDAFYGVSVELKDDEIAGFIEDYEEQLKKESRERESRKAKELASVRDRTRGKGK